MNATGIGYAGIEGAWWLPATAPFVLPRSAHDELQRIAESTFALFDAVTNLYDDDPAVRELLNFKVPPHLRRYVSKQRVLSVRPDFQLRVQRSERSKRSDRLPWFAATELEICPSAQGYAHAMQVGYGLDADLAAAFARMLGGRELVIVMTREWSEFIWEQLAFCRALQTHGARGRVWLDCPIEQLHDEVCRGLRWQPPIFGVSEKPSAWNDDVLARLRPFGDVLLRDLPTKGDGLALFRFGYLDCFAPDMLDRLLALEASGALAINPLHFAFDSKAVMATLQMDEMRQCLDAQMLAVLDRAIPETHVLTKEIVPQLIRERSGWVMKFAGFDHGQQAWGGRSLELGILYNDDSWQHILQQNLNSGWPVVAQRRVATGVTRPTYFDSAGNTLNTGWSGGGTRLRSFFVRDAGVYGNHITVSNDGGHVSEGTGAVQAPVVFADAPTIQSSG